VNIILGSLSPSKKEAVELALNQLQIDNVNIISINSESLVSSKPIGNEIIEGAKNRNIASKKYANDNNIDYDFLCAIEGGFDLDNNGIPFTVTYVVIENKKGEIAVGKSLVLSLSKEMFEFVKQGNSLNKVIEEMTGCSENKKKDGIVGYLTNGLITRSMFDKDAVLTALIPMLFAEQERKLTYNVKKQLN
jgi:inosine/xanthosine triphosphatase